MTFLGNNAGLKSKTCHSFTERSVSKILPLEPEQKICEVLEDTQIKGGNNLKGCTFGKRESFVN